MLTATTTTMKNNNKKSINSMDYIFLFLATNTTRKRRFKLYFIDWTESGGVFIHILNFRNETKIKLHFLVRE